MKTLLQRITLAVLMTALGASCSTAYDAYGRPRTVVEPGAALLGVAAAGLAGYAIANNRDRDHHRGHYRGHRGYDHHRHHRHYH
jgi:hypothetical protein